MNATQLQEPTVTIPTDTTPPRPTDVPPRTERHDWMFVGHNTSSPMRNDPPTDVYIADAAEVDQGIVRLLERDRAHARYPYLFVAPAVAPAFETAFVDAEIAAERANDQARTAPVWDVIIDLTAPFFVCAGHPNGCPVSHTVVCEDGQQSNPLVLSAATEEQRCVLRDYSFDEWVPMVGARRETFGALLDRLIRYAIHARLYAAEQMAGGWYILLIEPDQTLKTPGGARLRTQTDYQKLRSELDAPASLEQVTLVLEAIRKMWIAANQDEEPWERSADWPPAFVVHGVLKRQAEAAGTTVGAAARVVEAEAASPAPDSGLARDLETAIVKFHENKGRGMSRAEIGNKVTARKQNVSDNLKWLCRPGGSITRRRNGKADEYLPTAYA